jgi:hypothetical protein
MKSKEQLEYGLLGRTITTLILEYRKLGIANCPYEGLRDRADVLSHIVKEQLEAEVCDSS